MTDTLSPAGNPALPQRLEYGALLAFAAVLPLFEVPKNLLWVLLAALWLVNRWRAGDFGGRWDAWDTLIALWIASGYAAAMFAGIRDEEWFGANDILRYGSVLWMMKRGRYPDRVLQGLLVCIAAGTLAALAMGYYGLLVTKLRSTLGLRSVGHVNHSAIYLMIVFGMALAATRAYWAGASGRVRALGLGLLVLFTVSLFVMQSRAAVGMAFVTAFVVLVAYSVRLRLGVKPLLVGAMVVVALVLAAKPQVVEKNEALVQKGLFLSHRDGIWHAGLEAWRAFPLFGVGMKNYGRISQELTDQWRAQRGAAPGGALVFSSHGHSLYVNTLAERGGVGFAILLAVLGAWLYALARGLPRGSAPPLHWAYWGGAAAALIAAAGVGVVNTTLHKEHALVSMLLLGGWLCLGRPRPVT